MTFCVDIFELEKKFIHQERYPNLNGRWIKLTKALIIAIRVSSPEPTPTKFQEVATNLDISIELWVEG
ncbi:hypothetical protein RclHR1_14810003 [Rhizophagus clarus]|uniref:Uncharacterized protein n=1 Tax=Rhizophagus clarus TaxID=94130 RepID=A0A2Z6QDM3_9GLOM|nr:hypothetical protein RclHR1_14810003 [Rhizophagus clarus]